MILFSTYVHVDVIRVCSLTALKLNTFSKTSFHTSFLPVPEWDTDLFKIMFQ